MKKILLVIALFLCALAPCMARPSNAPVATINEAEFRDKVYACWLGKNIGGTLGMPFEGRQTIHTLTFFDPVPKTPAANDDLDLQILWLKALEERGTNINARTLGEYWLKYVPVNWNEYGTGKMNMKDGFLPPVSGHFRNEKWRNSNGAWIRSEIWACLAPGCPSIAVRYAYEDACVDHGASEGTYAEMFTAAVESAAFVEHDRDKLINIGLSYVPAGSNLAQTLRVAIDAHKKGLDLAGAREAVIKASEPTGWFQAPRNVAFTILGWLYGGDDFGASICDAVNCGDDTDCTGATLGSIFGIIHGGQCISEKWRAPVGTGIKNVAISGFQAPADLDELTARTIAMTKRVLKDNGAPVAITSAPTNLSKRAKLQLQNPKLAQELWARSPYKLVYDAGGVRVTFDYKSDPELQPSVSNQVDLVLENTTKSRAEVALAWKAADGLSTSAKDGKVTLKPGAKTTITSTMTQPKLDADSVLHGSVKVTANGKSVEIPFAYLCRKG